MTITTIELSQQQSYQQASHQSQKITLLEPASVGQHKSKIEPSISSLQASTQNKIEEVTYEKPKEIKLQLMVLVLEHFLGRSLDINDLSFHNNSDNDVDSIDSIFKPFSTIDAELINIDGRSFEQGDMLSVEQWQSHEQHLNYQIQGQFNINDQMLSLNYNFDLTSQRTSYSRIEMTAAALKDPLLVQFGSQALGDIKSEKVFDINQDNTLDELPIFSGDIGYLVFDQNGNQQADNGSELFGPTTGQGFMELAQLDSNKNGFIDAEDQAFEQLYIWQPNEDSSQAEQWMSLKEAKIQAISLSAINTPFNFYDQSGQIQAQLRQSSFSISDEGVARGVHQVDVRI